VQREDAQTIAGTRRYEVTRPDTTTPVKRGEAQTIAGVARYEVTRPETTTPVKGGDIANSRPRAGF
jgi:hypothetical protein